MKWYEKKLYQPMFGGELTPADRAEHDRLVAILVDADKAATSAKAALLDFQVRRNIVTDIGGTIDPCYKRPMQRGD